MGQEPIRSASTCWYKMVSVILGSSYHTDVPSPVNLVLIADWMQGNIMTDSWDWHCCKMTAFESGIFYFWIVGGCGQMLCILIHSLLNLRRLFALGGVVPFYWVPFATLDCRCLLVWLSGTWKWNSKCLVIRVTHVSQKQPIPFSSPGTCLETQLVLLFRAHLPAL